MEICAVDMKTALGVDPNIHITQEHRSHCIHTHTEMNAYCIASAATRPRIAQVQ